MRSHLPISLRIPISVLALSGSCAFAADPPPSPAEALSLLQRIDEGFVQVFEKVAPSVVVIDVGRKKEAGLDEDFDGLEFFLQQHEGEGAGRQFRMPQPPARSEGSGFIIRADGYIITNQHVIADAEKVVAKLKDGRQFEAKVVGMDDKTDVAILKIEAADLQAAEFGDSEKIRVGQLVCAIGVPYALDYSFTAGWVSAKGRTLNQAMYEDYIQTDAFINPGNSGGPLFDVQGKVVGMNTLINGIGRGLAFAIPSNMLRDISAQLIARGRMTRPWLGIRIATLGENAFLRQRISGIDRGVVVDAIEADAPAYGSDLRPTDVILQVDDIEVGTALDLQKVILKKRVGQEVILTVWRDGKTIKVPVVTGELPAGAGRIAAPEPVNPGPQKDFVHGLSLQNINRDLMAKFKLKAGAGVFVADVAQNSPAALAEVRPQDVITAIDSRPITDAATARELIGKHDPKKGVLLFLDRRGQKTYAMLRAEAE